MRTVAVLLAAGGGTRFAGATHKLLADLQGRPVVAHAVEHAVASAIGPVIMVTGAVDLAPALEVDPTVTVLHHPRWSDGQATSLTIAIAAADRLQADAVVMALGDQPFISPLAWQMVAAAPADHQIVVASYDGARGPHPVRLHRSIWAALPHTGDDGARTLIRRHPALVHEVLCPGSAADIDTLEDLQRWTSS